MKSHKCKKCGKWHVPQPMTLYRPGLCAKCSMEEYIKANPEDLESTLQFIKKMWKKYPPNT